MFWERFYEQCLKNGTKPNPLAKKIGISSGVISKWKNENTIPNGDTLIKIAETLNCSVDYLLGLSSANIFTHGISPIEQTLLSQFRSLSPKGQEYIQQTMNAALVLYKNTEADLKLVANKPVSAPAIIDDELRHT